MAAFFLPILVLLLFESCVFNQIVRAPAIGKYHEKEP